MKISQSLFSVLVVMALIAGLFVPAGTTGQSVYIPDSLKYLGQSPPDSIPVRFPPDDLLANADWFWHGPVTFSPDLEEMYWGENIVLDHKGDIFYMMYDNGQWLGPYQTYFTMDDYSYNNPFFGTSHDTLWFQSSKPGGFISYVTWQSYYWSDPVQLSLQIPSGKSRGLQFSMSGTGDIYAELDEGKMDINIYRWKKVNGSYLFPEKLDSTINSPEYDFCPFIDPYEQYMVFSSTRPGGYGGFDLYLSNHNQDGTWSVPINLGSTINTEADEWAPSITPDGLYLFFLSHRGDDLGYNPYWVSADVVYQLVTGVSETGNQRTNLPFILYQNTPNPFSTETLIKYSLLKSGFVTMTIYSAMGVPIKTVVNQLMPKGTHEISFDAGTLPAGIYICSLRVDYAVRTRIMVILK